MGEDELTAETVPGAPDDGGRWLRIGFMGHFEYAGWVTEIIRNGQPAYRVELPDYLWAGDESAWVEHSAASWHHSNPLNDRALRREWEAGRRRRAEIAEWEARQKAARLAIEAAAEDEADTIAREEAGEDWDAPDRERDGDNDVDDDDEEGGPF